MKKTTVYLNEAEVQGLQRLSADSGASQAELIRTAVRELVGEQPQREFRSMGIGRGGGYPAGGWDADELYESATGDARPA